MKSQNSPNLYLSVLHTEIYSSCISKYLLVLHIEISTCPGNQNLYSSCISIINISTCPVYQNLYLSCTSKSGLVLHYQISTRSAYQHFDWSCKSKSLLWVYWKTESCICNSFINSTALELNINLFYVIAFFIMIINHLLTYLKGRLFCHCHSLCNILMCTIPANRFN